MRLLLAAVLVLMLSSAALAAPETHQIGSYKVSFDLNTQTKYQIQTPNPQGNAYAEITPLVIKTDNSTMASVSITEYKSPVDSTLQMQSALAFWQTRARGINATVPANTTIDGNNGFVLSGVPFPGSNAPAGYKLFQAQYWLDSKQCECGPIFAGKTSVDILSTYPQDVTMNLLKSIHVVKTA